MVITKYSSSILSSSQKVLSAFNAHKEKTVQNAQKLLNDVKKDHLIKSFKTYKTDKLKKSENLILIYREEKQLHHFDIFRKAGFVANENRLSDAVAAVLNPKGSHQLGIDPLLQLLNQLIERNPGKINDFIRLVKKNKSQLVVYREKHEENTIPDIEIVCSDFLIFIENKIREGSETFIKEWQTNRQWKALSVKSDSLNISKENILGIFLTPERKPAKNENFMPLSVSELVSALRHSARKAKNMDTKYSLLAFLNYYDWE